MQLCSFYTLTRHPTPVLYYPNMDQRTQNSFHQFSYSPIDEGGDLSPLRPVPPVSFTGTSDDSTAKRHLAHFDASDFARPSQSCHYFQSRFQERNKDDISMGVLRQAHSDDDGQRLVESRGLNDSTHFGQSEKVAVQTVPLLQSRRRMIVFVGLALSWLAVSFQPPHYPLSTTGQRVTRPFL